MRDVKRKKNLVSPNLIDFSDQKPGQLGKDEGVVQRQGGDCKYQGGRFHSEGKKVALLPIAITII